MKIEPHCIEWTKTGWANTFHSTPPKDADIQTKLYTEAQMLQLGEACASKADDMENSFNSVGGAIRNLIKEMLP